MRAAVSITGSAPPPGWDDPTPPPPPPDWTEWLNIPKVPLRQAVALSLDIEPNSGTIPSAEKDEFRKRVRIAEANLKEPVKLSEFVQFALSIKWSLPPQLARIAAGGRATARARTCASLRRRSRTRMRSPETVAAPPPETAAPVETVREQGQTVAQTKPITRRPRRRPTETRALRAIGALWPNDVPEPDLLSNEALCNEVKAWLEASGDKLPISPDSILRAAVRRPRGN